MAAKKFTEIDYGKKDRRRNEFKHLPPRKYIDPSPTPEEKAAIQQAIAQNGAARCYMCCSKLGAANIIEDHELHRIVCRKCLSMRGTVPLYDYILYQVGAPKLVRPHNGGAITLYREYKDSKPHTHITWTQVKPDGTEKTIVSCPLS